MKSLTTFGHWPKLECRSIEWPVAGLATAMSVGVVVPVHNNADVVEATLQSLLVNLGPGDRISVVENGSTDESWAFLCERFGNHPQISLSRLSVGDAAAARNLGIDRAGEVDYIAFCDSDDEWLPGRLDQVRAVLVETKADMLVQPMLTQRNAAIEVEGATFRRKQLPLQSTLLAELIVSGNFVSTSALVLRRDRIPLPLFAEGLRQTQDYEAWCWFARHNPDACVAYVDDPQVIYRWMGGLSNKRWHRVENVYRIARTYGTGLSPRVRRQARMMSIARLLLGALRTRTLWPAIRLLMSKDDHRLFRGAAPMGAVRR